jgi:imidazole glycerol-phosphate synthase subunit HisH
LCESTEEGNVSCLGHIPGEIKKLKTGTLSSPHMGWNNLAPINPHPLTENITTDEFVYFVHSFAHEVNQFTLTTGEYGQLFSAVVAKDNFAGMQFHPEKSAKVGAKLLSNFINWQL